MLLKNEGGLLPLDKHIGSVAVIGPGAAQAMLGDYTENRGRTGTISILDGIRAVVSPDTKVRYARGCNFLGQALHPFDPGYLRDEEGNVGLTGRYYNGRCPKAPPCRSAPTRSSISTGSLRRRTRT